MAPLLRELFASLLFIALLSTHAEDKVEDIEDPKAILKMMDKDEDGLLTEDELHMGVRALFAERGVDEQEFEKHFASMLKTYFPKSDANSDGKLNPEELQAFMMMMDEHDADEDPKTILKMMDKDEDGLLTEDELHMGVKAWFAGKGHDEQEFEKHFASMLKIYFLKSDANSDGKLDPEELQAFMMMMMDEHEADEDPETILKMMDKDEDGLLTEDELHVGARALFAGKGVDEQEFEKHFVPMLNNYFPKSDADSDGKLNLEELQAFMKMMDEHEAEESSEVGRKCEFDNPPAGVGSFWDPTCAEVGGLGCNADGKHVECRLCGGGDLTSVQCPPSSCHFPLQPHIPYFWDNECEEGKLGCRADGIHTQCRFCGDFPFSAVPCPLGAAAPPTASCNFTSEPAIPAYWEPGCALGMHGCNADGQNVQCRHCGKGEFSHIHCPGSQVCAFQIIPTVPYYYEPNCHSGMLGCKADGVHDECRFCGEAPFESVHCPRPHKDVEICRSTLGPRSVPYFWDESCEDGKLGCFADGITAQCRFCGGGNYTEVQCPDTHSNNLRGSSQDP